MREQVRHLGRLIETARHAFIGVIGFDTCPVLPLHGWEIRDEIVSIETTAGDLEVADPEEVAQYQRWADLLRNSARPYVSDAQQSA
jgi:hypothetical protein